MKLHKTIYIAATLACAAMLAGCSGVRGCKAPQLNLPQTIASGANTDSVTIADMEWWKFYGDSALCRIIGRTLGNNRNLMAAAARVEQARQAYRVDKANRLPSVGASILADHETNDYYGESLKKDPEFDFKASLNWEIDLWGSSGGQNAKVKPCGGHQWKTNEPCA